MDTLDPAKHNRLGRNDRGCNHALWNCKRISMARTGNYFVTFAQNPGFRHYLLSTADRLLGEASLFNSLRGRVYAPMVSPLYIPLFGAVKACLATCCKIVR